MSSPSSYASGVSPGAIAVRLGGASTAASHCVAPT